MPSKVALILVVLLACPSLVWCFPPLPYYTLFGTVRDQVGQTLSSSNAEVQLLQGDRVIESAPVSLAPSQGSNYELNLEIDGGRSGTKVYSEQAAIAKSSVVISVLVDGLRFYPIETSGTYSVGQGGERVRLDLTLGQDTDGDGLPDAWEEWQLYQAGRFPTNGSTWNIALVDRHGDLDGDGASNLLEYLAGTFAGDATESFALQIIGFENGAPIFEFYAITNKTYTLQSSTDLTNWSTESFSVGLNSAAREYVAPAVGIVAAKGLPVVGAAKKFYRLLVQ
jgi:hypothetical protein